MSNLGEIFSKKDGAVSLDYFFDNNLRKNIIHYLRETGLLVKNPCHSKPPQESTPKKINGLNTFTTWLSYIINCTD